MPPGTVPAAVEVHDSMFGGIVAVLRVSIVGVSAHFRLTRVDTTRSPPTHGSSSGQRSGGRNDGCGRRFTLPLDKLTYISAGRARHPLSIDR